MNRVISMWFENKTVLLFSLCFLTCGTVMCVRNYSMVYINISGVTEKRLVSLPKWPVNIIHSIHFNKSLFSPGRNSFVVSDIITK